MFNTCNTKTLKTGVYVNINRQKSLIAIAQKQKTWLGNETQLVQTTSSLPISAVITTSQWHTDTQTCNS